MNEYLKWTVIAGVIVIVGYILYVNLRRRRTLKKLQEKVSETLYRQAQLDQQEALMEMERNRKPQQPSIGEVRATMLEIAKNHQLLLDDEAMRIMEGVYDTFLNYGASENVCLFAEMLEARLARSIACRRNCDEAQNMAASLIEQLLSYIISLHPSHYQMKLKTLIDRARGILNAPTNTNWVQAITLS